MANDHISPTIPSSSSHVETITKDYGEPSTTTTTTQYGEPSTSTGNNKQVIQAKMRDMVIKSKLWKDQRDFDDEEGWGEGLAGYSSSGDDQEFDDDSEGEDIDAQFKPKFQRKSATINCPANLQPAANTNNNLNHNAPVFVQRNTTKSGETSVADRNTTALPTTAQNQIVPIKSITTLEERKMSDAMRQPFHTTQRQQSIATTPTNFPSADNKTIPFSQTGPHQLVSTAPEITLQERQLLDARTEDIYMKKGRKRIS